MPHYPHAGVADLAKADLAKPAIDFCGGIAVPLQGSDCTCSAAIAAAVTIRKKYAAIANHRDDAIRARRAQSCDVFGWVNLAALGQRLCHGRNCP
jgi:hypothetical protein